MKRGTVEVIRHCEGGAVGNQGEDTLVLGGRRGVVEGSATELVTSTDLTTLTDHHVHTLNVTAGREKLEHTHAHSSHHLTSSLFTAPHTFTLHTTSLYHTSHCCTLTTSPHTLAPHFTLTTNIVTLHSSHRHTTSHPHSSCNLTTSHPHYPNTSLFTQPHYLTPSLFTQPHYLTPTLS